MNRTVARAPRVQPGVSRMSSCCNAASTLAPETLKSVQNYYGKVLETSKDLKTSACTAVSRPHSEITKIMKQIPDEVRAKFYGCGAPLPLGIDGLRVLDLGSGSGRDCYVASKLVGQDGARRRQLCQQACSQHAPGSRTQRCPRYCTCQPVRVQRAPFSPVHARTSGALHGCCRQRPRLCALYQTVTLTLWRQAALVVCHRCTLARHNAPHPCKSRPPPGVHLQELLLCCILKLAQLRRLCHRHRHDRRAA